MTLSVIKILVFLKSVVFWYRIVPKLQPGSINKLNYSKANLNWEDEDERRVFLRHLYPILRTWKGELPDLKTIFRKEDIDWLLLESLKLDGQTELHTLISFVVCCNYQDEPDINEDGQLLLRRDTAIHYALKHDMAVDVLQNLFLVYNKFDANYTSENGFTHFQAACKSGNNDIVKRFLDFGHDPNVLMPGTGEPMLHVALRGSGKMQMVESLLRKGANPNLVCKRGFTLLHVMCKMYNDVRIVEKFFQICDDIQQSVQINAQDDSGYTPLHYTLTYGFAGTKEVSELLLRRGADPNVAEENGLTPLHFICNNIHSHELAKHFLQICSDINQPVQIDARDNFSQTPLQFSVCCLIPKVVDVLLDYGANLSKFKFPTASNICEQFSFRYVGGLGHGLKLATTILHIVELLEKRKYKLKQSDALMLMSLFTKYRLFGNSADFDGYWYENEEFAIEAKKIMINSSLSLYEFIQLRPEETRNRLTVNDYLQFYRSKKLKKFPKMYQDACTTHLLEKSSRRFFLRWALESFPQLMGNRLPLLCCEEILKKLTNKDLKNICFARFR